ncbi:MAG: DUF4402 domain-containing protein [Bacteroidetes bacterium]|nr:DUF4402 domain-containing protein [Bacteroidota bacterium]MCL5738486.1 DUF4402 domain-containing protein [Bacteroidota bacterium]
MKRFCQTALLIFALIFGVNEASAQNPTITLLRWPLSFGMVITNTTNTIAPTDPNAAEIEVKFPAYNGSAFIWLTFTLPTYLTSGANNLSITFGTNSAAYNTTNSLSGSTTFDPSLGYFQVINSNTPLTLYVWIGGTVSPTNRQATGDYTGTINVNALAWVFAFPFPTYQANQNIPVSATVIKGLSLIATGSLDFGTVLAGMTPAPLSAQTNGNAPMFTAAGSRNRKIFVTYSTTIFLNDGYGNKLTFSPSLYGSSNSLGQTTSQSVAAGSSVTLSGASSGTGYYYFWLGGSLNSIPTGQPPGNYTGTFTLTVNY